MCRDEGRASRTFCHLSFRGELIRTPDQIGGPSDDCECLRIWCLTPWAPTQAKLRRRMRAMNRGAPHAAYSAQLGRAFRPHSTTRSGHLGADRSEATSTVPSERSDAWMISCSRSARSCPPSSRSYHSSCGSTAPSATGRERCARRGRRSRQRGWGRTGPRATSWSATGW